MAPRLICLSAVINWRLCFLTNPPSPNLQYDDKYKWDLGEVASFLCHVKIQKEDGYLQTRELILPGA